MRFDSHTTPDPRLAPPLCLTLPVPDLDTQNADAVVAALDAGALANSSAACRQGSIDRIAPPGRLIATGDLHDNPAHLARLIDVAGLSGPESGASNQETEASGPVSKVDDAESTSAPIPPLPASAPSHLVLHEIIHSDRLYNGMDFSYRALARVAALKAAFPEQVHVLLANHELSQVVGAGIVKDGVRVVEAFDAGVEYVFGEDSGRIRGAIARFIRSMPLALRCSSPAGDILVSHSLPNPAMMSRFDPQVLERELTDADYEPRQGSAHLLVWGRGYDAELIEDLVERWGVGLFILGHEKIDEGARFIRPCAVVLNSDHDRGVFLPLDLDRPPRAEEAVRMAIPLALP